MTDQEQQIALCEWAGWKRKEPPEFLKDEQVRHLWTVWTRDGIDLSVENLPDTNSLDVLHEMELKLNTYELKDSFVRYLLVLLDIHIPFEGNPLFVWHKVINATAAQRREALLRTLGLWKE